MNQDVTLSVDKRCAVLTIDRPEARNAIDRPTIDALTRLLDEVESLVGRDEVGVLAIRGGGDRVFVSGGDLKELATIRTEREAREMALSMRGVLDRVGLLPVPTVAVLNGHALGGGAEVAIACDMRVAASDVRIGFTQVHLGIMPAWGGVERLAKLVGRGRACHLLLTGVVLEAQEATRFGLVEQVVDRSDFDTVVQTLLAHLAALTPTVARGILAVVDRVWQPDSPETTVQATDAFAQAWVSAEHWAAAEHQARLRAERRAGSGARR